MAGGVAATGCGMKKRSKGLWALQAARAAAGLAFLAVFGLLAYHLYEYRQGDRIYEEARTAAVKTSEPAKEDAKDGVPERSIDFAALRELNPDCVAWIYGCGGAIDYPVVTSQDDTYYLTHTISGGENRAGCIFVDRYAEEPFAEFQTILYGHNMKNGSMFHALLNYQNKDYWEEYPAVTVYLDGETKEYGIFAAYYASYEDLPVYESVETPKQREEYLARLKTLSLYDTKLRPDADARLLTLITCEYSGEDYRMVVHGMEISALQQD